MCLLGRYSVHRFVEPSLFNHVLDAEHSGRRDIITSSKGFVIIHVLLDIVERNALFFKSTWIWISKWGASPVKHKHSFILSSWIGKRVERWWQFIESVNCICTTVYHQFVGFKWNLPFEWFYCTGMSKHGQKYPSILFNFKREVLCYE